MLRILYDDFDQKVKNDEIDLHHSYKKKRVQKDFQPAYLFNFDEFMIFEFCELCPECQITVDKETFTTFIVQLTEW